MYDVLDVLFDLKKGRVHTVDSGIGFSMASGGRGKGDGVSVG